MYKGREASTDTRHKNSNIIRHNIKNINTFTVHAEGD